MFLISPFIGMPRTARERLEKEVRSRQEAEMEELPKVPDPVSFKAKHGLPTLPDYGVEVFPEEYWAHWIKKSFLDYDQVRSWVDPDKFLNLARRAGYWDMEEAARVCNVLRSGARLGCTGRGRLPTFQRNGKDVAVYGERVADALQSWTLESPPIAFGPLREEELPWDDFTVNPLGVKVRWDGKARPLVDASSPHDSDDSVPPWIYSPEYPGSVNSTILSEDFPTIMSSTERFVRALWRVGRGARVMKKDLVSAYKHQRVHPDDLKLQVVKFGGRYFVELALMFGSRSSPGIFCDLLGLFVRCIILLSGIPDYLVEQHLDDVLAIDGGGMDDPVARFNDLFLEEAEKVGFRPDISSNRDKNQEPDTEVTALGVIFDTVKWEWGFSDQRLAIILNTLSRIEQGERLTRVEMESLVGKLNAVKFMVEGGRFYLDSFYRSMEGVEGAGSQTLEVKWLRAQSKWWRISLLIARKSSKIRFPEDGIPGNALRVWSDAAGGSKGRMGPGLGVVYPRTLSWAYLPWPAWLNEGGRNSDGVRFDSKLTVLEGLGPLVAVCVAGRDAMGKVLVALVDNQGTVGVYRKGHGKGCPYATCLVRAAYVVARGMAIGLRVEKIRRCSDGGSVLADAISKGDIDVLRRAWPFRRNLVEIPSSLLDWIRNPVDDMELGEKILGDLMARGLEVVIPHRCS